MTNYLLHRPVNALKKLHTPAYLGAKIRSSESTTLKSKVLELSIKKRLNSSESWNYKSFPVFKGINDEGQPEYRDYLAPSPSSASAEAFIINELCDQIAPRRVPNVYSYILAQKNSAYNYQYYLPHYQRRNQNILEALGKESGLKAIFLDIKNFYASVDKSLLISSIKKHEILGAKQNAFATNFILNQIEQSSAGIPIGTELSHIVADIFLSKLDTKLEERFKHNYFRYVDDITIVCKEGDIEECEKLVNSEISNLGLQLNEAKRELFTHEEWRNEMDTSPVDGEDFYSHCQMLGKWINGDSRRTSHLDSALKSEGFQIPLRKIFTSQSHAPQPYRPEMSELEIIKNSKKIRQKYLSALEQVSENLSNDSSRWYLQKTKRALNPLFYLLNKENYETISRTARESKKLRPQEEVSNAIHKNSCDSIVAFPGVTVNTFCEIWRTTQPKELRVDEYTAKKSSSAEIESLTTLALFEIIEPPSCVQSSSLWSALRPEVGKISETINGFDAEIESLRIGLSKSTQQALLDNRLSEEEEIILNGLELGNQSISP